MLEQVQSWFQAHQVVAGALIFPMITCFFNLLLKPRSPEQYDSIAKSWPRVAAVLKFLGGFGTDPYKVATSIEQILSGTSAPVIAMRRFGSDGSSPIKIGPSGSVQ